MDRNDIPGSVEPNRIPRRKFLKMAGVVTVGAMAPEWVFAGPFQNADFGNAIPADKKLRPEWVKSLTARGKRTEYTGKQLAKIGMPIGGICAGGLYIGGDGRLWLWDIFNSNKFGISPKPITYLGKSLDAGGGSAYVEPPDQVLPFDQGFSVAIDGQPARPLDHRGFKDIRFIGEYPVANVRYLDHPTVTVELEAFSPFIPLNADDSSLPATLMHYTFTNRGTKAVEVKFAGWMENPLGTNRGLEGTYRLTYEAMQDHGVAMFKHGVESVKHATSDRFDLPFELWDKDTYAGWTVEGTAFGAGPIAKSKIPDYQGDVGGVGDRLVNSHATAPGNSVTDKDGAVGKLTSKSFQIERNFLQFYIGGGNHPGQTCLNLVVEGKVVRTASGNDNNKMRAEVFQVADLIGKQAHIEIIDSVSGPWGNIGIGRITQTDSPVTAVPIEAMADYGTLSLGLVGAGVIESHNDTSHTASVSRTFTLEPGAFHTVTAVVAWHFPNLRLGIPDDTSGQYYSTKFRDSGEVVRFIASHHDRLAHQTRLWHNTWYDSTLPYWFLDRTFANTSILATTTAHRFGTGRFYAWEGVGCCAGTCTHVWHYAQAMGRIFPELERILRTRVDYGLAFNERTGEIGFRAEYDRRAAMDGQAGSILRMYREHQMTTDPLFLRERWSRVKQSIEYMIASDKNVEGVLQGPQENTLDAAWYGKIAWITSLYLAALKAGEMMALEMNDAEFAKRCQGILQQGTKNIDRDLFNGEYYIQTRDSERPNALGTYDCCHIDQVMGQGWAWQVGLGRVMDRKNTVSALRALYKYNFTPDVGPWRKAHTEGRWYAMPGDGGLIMTTNPKGNKAAFGDPSAWQFGYFNECMSGFEHQAAAHMIAEGLVTEGLAITKAIHDRYRADLRNPWNEIECSDHYARAMASYGSFISICGFEYHAQRKTIGFTPRLKPENFRAAFTAAEGWGTFSQARNKQVQKSELSVKYGQLSVQTIALDAGKTPPKKVVVLLGEKPIKAKLAVQDSRVLVLLESPVTIGTKESLQILLSFIEDAE